MSAPENTSSAATLEADRKARWQAIAVSNRDAIIAALREAGVTRVVVAFDGYGDEGNLEGISPYVGEDVVELPAVQVEVCSIPWFVQPDTPVTPEPTGLKDAIEQLTYDMLGEFEGGWENNEGAYGEMILDVEAGTARLEFNARFVESVFSAHTV